MKRGEVWRVRIPIAPGHVQFGERPAIIVQDDAFNARLPTVLIVPLTGSQATKRFPGTMSIAPDANNGLTVPSVALAFQLRVLDQSDCLKHLGVVDSQTLDQLFRMIDHIMGR
jgi:mRNA interferase MazF